MNRRELFAFLATAFGGKVFAGKPVLSQDGFVKAEDTVTVDVKVSSVCLWVFHGEDGEETVVIGPRDLGPDGLRKLKEQAKKRQRQ